MESIIGGEESLDQLYKFISRYDQRTIKTYWAKAKRLQRLMIVRRVLGATAIYLVPPTNYNPNISTVPKRWNVGYIFTLKNPKCGFIFIPDGLPSETSQPAEEPTPVEETINPKRKPGRPKRRDFSKKESKGIDISKTIKKLSDSLSKYESPEQRAFIRKAVKIGSTD